MINRSSPTLPARTSWLVFFMSAVALGTGACASTGTVHSEQPRATIIPGVPNLPDRVTVIPFYWKANETPEEKTKVVVLAEVDGRRGVFIVDLGAPPLNLSRTFLQPSPTGGVDSVTNTNRIPEQHPNGEDSVHVTLRLGTLIDTFVDPTVAASDPRHVNAFLNHEWGNFGWNFAPRLGNISLTALEPFETIIDYAHRRLVLIRLDKAGHRLAQVPAYTPKWTSTLIDVGDDGRKRWVSGWQWWGIMVGAPSASSLAYTLDTLNPANNTLLRALETGGATNGDDCVAYPFLSGLGVFGINHRTHQFILYR
jgi:hypothetical protein